MLESEAAAGVEVAQADGQVAEKQVLALVWPAGQVARLVAGQVAEVGS